VRRRAALEPDVLGYVRNGDGRLCVRRRSATRRGAKLAFRTPRAGNELLPVWKNEVDAM